MKQGLVEIACVVDRSGSMSSMRDEAIGAFNTFLEEQKKHPGEALMTYTQFDNEYEIVHSGKPIKDVPALTTETYVPRGSTALLDAVGRTIDAVGTRLSGMADEERPEKVLFVVLTDGQENASKEYKLDDVKKKIDLQRDKYKWEFVFLAQGPAAFAGAINMGFAAKNVSAYAAGDAVAHRKAVRNLSSSTESYRSGGAPDWSGKS